MKDKLTVSKGKELRNQEIYLEIASGITKDVICKKWNISLTQLNRILKEAREETNQWYKSLPTQMMIQIFRFNCSKILEEIQRLEAIRNKIKDDLKIEFEMTQKIINTRFNYSKMISEGPTLATTTLMEDFQRAILPITNPWSCRGKEILIIAQTLAHAREHLRTLRSMILQSEKYRGFLITKYTDVVRRDEVTKVGVIYLKNPSFSKPTRIIGLGPEEAGIWSWKDVKHIHMSDVAAISQVDDSGFFGAAMSRLMNTSGSMHIETPPRGQRGKIWELYKKFAPGIGIELTESQKAAAFHVETIKADQAVQAGIMKKEDLEDERERNPVLFGQLYECEFMNPYTNWYEESMIKYNKDLADEYIG